MAELCFSDGDNDVLIYPRDYVLAELPFVVAIDESSVTFTRADEYGRPHTLAEDARLWKENKTKNPFVEKSHRRFFRFDAADQWEPHSFLAPTVSALNTARAQLELEGAHPLPLSLEHGDDDEGLFNSITMTQAIADGVFPISTNARHYAHDTIDHGLGVVSMHHEAVDKLQALCKLALSVKSEDRHIGYSLAQEIIAAYDHATFNYSSKDRQGVPQIKSGRHEALFGYALQFVWDNPHISEFYRAQVLRCIESGPFYYNPAKRMVVRHPAVTEYYERIGELIISSEHA